jgi:hypothetical protein
VPTSKGLLNWPPPVPGEPHVRRRFPFASNFLMRLLKVSATYTLPSGATATPLGEKKPPTTQIGVRLVSNLMRRLQPKSMTYEFPFASKSMEVD